MKTSQIPAILLLLILALATTSAQSANPIDLGSRLEPLVDRFLIQTLKGKARLQLHKPQRREVVLVHDVPWEGNLTAHHTLFRDGDIYRMYYGGRHYEPGKQVRHVLVSYAESRDGLRWTRPKLGLYEYEGSKENNIVWMDDPWAKREQRNPMAIFKDTNPACAPDARYKSVARGDDGVYALKSPDGIHWSLLSPKPVIPKPSHAKTQIEKFSHIFRVKWLFGGHVKVFRDIRQVEIKSIPLGSQVNPIQIADTLVPDQAHQRSAGDLGQAGFHRLPPRLEERVLN